MCAYARVSGAAPSPTVVLQMKLLVSQIKNEVNKKKLGALEYKLSCWC
jgi:hypothetical protein